VVSSVGISETSNSSTVQAAVHGRKRHKSNKSCPAFRRKMMKALKATNKDTRNLVKAINKYDYIDFKMCYMNKGSWGWRLATSNKNSLIYKVQPSPETAITVHQFAKKNKLNSLQVKGIRLCSQALSLIHMRILIICMLQFKMLSCIKRMEFTI